MCSSTGSPQSVFFSICSSTASCPGATEGSLLQCLEPLLPFSSSLPGAGRAVYPSFFLCAGCQAALCPPFFPKLSLRKGTTILAAGPSRVLPWGRWSQHGAAPASSHAATTQTPAPMDAHTPYSDMAVT